MPFQKGHPRFPPRDGSAAARARATKERHERLYEQVDSVPDGLTWKPVRGSARSKTQTVLCSIGNIYKLIRIRDTGAVTYYRLKGSDTPATPAAQIDAEPQKQRTRFDVGNFCWFVDDNGRWFCCEIVARTTQHATLKPTTGWDADRQVTWRFGELLKLHVGSPTYLRVKPLKARQA